jgi:kynureninase
MATFTVTAVSDPIDRRTVGFTTGRTDPLAWDFDAGRSGGGTMLRGSSASYRFAADGTFTVRALAPNGDSGTVRVTIGPRQVSQIVPPGGAVAGGTVVQLYGVGLTGATGVLFDTTAGTAFAVTSDSLLTVTSPAHAAGAVDVTVQHPAGNIVKAAAFTYA